jgi:hypothetical protein
MPVNQTGNFILRHPIWRYIVGSLTLGIVFTLTLGGLVPDYRLLVILFLLFNLIYWGLVALRCHRRDLVSNR